MFRSYEIDLNVCSAALCYINHYARTWQILINSVNIYVHSTNDIFQCTLLHTRNLRVKSLVSKYWYRLSPDHWWIQGGPRRRAPPPQQDQFLSFSHMFSPKSVRIRGWHPLQWFVAPPNGKSWIRHCWCLAIVCKYNIWTNHCMKLGSRGQRRVMVNSKPAVVRKLRNLIIHHDYFL